MLSPVARPPESPMRTLVLCALVSFALVAPARPPAAKGPRELIHSTKISYYKWGTHKFPGAYEMTVTWGAGVAQETLLQMKFADEYAVTVAWEGPAGDKVEMKVD